MTPLLTWLLLSVLFAAAWAAIGASLRNPRDWDGPLAESFSPGVEAAIIEALNVVDLADINEQHRLHRLHLADQIAASQERHPSGAGHVTAGIDHTKPGAS